MAKDTKSKKKASNGKKKPAQNTQPQTASVTPATPKKKKKNPKPASTSRTHTQKSSTRKLTKPDRWELTDETTITFYRKDEPIMRLPYTPEATFTLTEALKLLHPETDALADAWTFKTPNTFTANDTTPPPVLTFTNGQRILAYTPLEQKELKQLVKTLSKKIEKPAPVKDTIIAWWKKHKVMRVFAVIIALPLAFYVMYTLAWSAGIVP